VAYAEYTHMCVLYRGYVGGIYAEGGKDEDDEGQVGVSPLLASQVTYVCTPSLS